MINKERISIISNIAAPYRIPLFEVLSKKHQLHVYFCARTSKGRQWAVETKKWNFKYTILRSFNLGFLVVNPTIIVNLIFNRKELYVIAENPENFLTILVIYILKPFLRYKVILWNERLNNQIYTLNDFAKEYSVLYKLIEWMYKKYRLWLYSKSEVILTLSKASKIYLLTSGVSESKIIYTPQIYPRNLLPMPKKVAEKPAGKVTILYLGQLWERKGVDKLILAFKSLDQPNIDLKIVGSGEYSEYLKKIAKNASNIYFKDFLEGEEKSREYITSDIFVLPSSLDVWGMVINEALYFNLPVITTKQVAASELVKNGETGYVIPDNTISSIELALKGLVEKKGEIERLKKNIIQTDKKRFVDIGIMEKAYTKAILTALC